MWTLCLLEIFLAFSSVGKNRFRTNCSFFAAVSMFVYKGKNDQILKTSPGIFASIKTQHFEINCHLTVCYYKNPILHVKA